MLILAWLRLYHIRPELKMAVDYLVGLPVARHHSRPISLIPPFFYFEIGLEDHRLSEDASRLRVAIVLGPAPSPSDDSPLLESYFLQILHITLSSGLK